jgi:hypothetical protein
MKIERSVSQEYLSNDNLKTIYTRSAGVDFGELAIIVLLSIVVYESIRSGFFLTIPLFVWYAVFVVLIIWIALSIITFIIALIAWNIETFIFY